jgi:hypothetical protein
MSEKEITQAIIDDWKSKYGEVYKIDLGDEDYYYRPLRRAEYKTILQSQGDSTSFREEQIVQKCVIYPEIDGASTAGTKAGVVSTLTDCVMMVSGFGVDNEPVKL